MNSRSPFTSEKAHREVKQPAAMGEIRPDGGFMKRVHSQPSLSLLAMGGGAPQGGSGLTSRGMGGTLASLTPNAQRPRANSTMKDELDAQEGELGVEEDNCFLRLHVPHFMARERMSFVKTGQTHP